MLPSHESRVKPCCSTMYVIFSIKMLSTMLPALQFPGKLVLRQSYMVDTTDLKILEKMKHCEV